MQSLPCAILIISNSLLRFIDKSYDTDEEKVNEQKEDEEVEERNIFDSVIDMLVLANRNEPGI